MLLFLSWSRRISFFLTPLFSLLFYPLSLSPIIITTFSFFLFLSVLGMLNIHLGKELFFETFWQRFNMHVITITSSFASSLYMLFAFGIKEISNWRKLCLDFFSIPKSSICIFLCILSILFLTVLYIDIANDMITKVINNNHILNFSIFHHLLENFFIKILAFCHSSIGISSGHIIPINESCLNSIVLIHVL